MNLLYSGLLAASVILIQCLIGGTRLVHALPAYAIIVLVSLLSLRSFRASSARPSLVCLFVTAIYFSYILVRAAFSPWDTLWWQDFYQVIACLMVYGVFTLYGWKAGPRLLFVGMLLALAVVEFFIGLRQFRYGDSWMPFGFIRIGGGLRASGTLISSIHYAGFLEAIGPFALALTFWGKRWPAWSRFVSGYIAVLCYAGVAISGSRGAYLSTVFSIGVFAILSLIAVRRTRPEKLGAVLGIGTVVLCVALAGGVVLMLKNPMLQHRLNMLASQDLRIYSWLMADGTSASTARPGVDVRIYNWQAALDQIRVEPVFGTGAGTHLYYGRLFRRPQIQSDPIHAHSDYLEMLAEYGIVGLAGMVLFVGVHLVHGGRRFFHVLGTKLRDLDYYVPARSDDLAMLIGALTAVSAYLAHSVVDFNLHIPGNALTFAFIFGVLASPGRNLDGAAPSWAERGFRLAIPALGIWMAVVGLPKYPGEYWCEKARVALRDRRFRESIDLAHRAIEHEKRNFELYFYLGEAERNLALRLRNPERNEHLEAAVDAFRKSLEIFPYDEHVLVRLAQALGDLGRLAEASAEYRKAIEHDPNLGVLHAYYARHLYRIGREDEAHESFKTAQKLGAANLNTIVDPAFTDVPAEPAIPAQPRQ